MPTVIIKNCEKYDSTIIYKIIKDSLKKINLNIKNGSTVLLKPNVLQAAKQEQHITTNPVILDAVCRILKEKKCRIIIADSCGGGFKAEIAFRKTGIEKIAKKYKTKLMGFEGQPLMKCKGRFLRELYLPKLIRDVDLIINLPKLKTHMFMQYTGGIKNLFGFIPGGKKQEYHIIGYNEKRFANILLDIYENVTPQLNIMDAVYGMEGNGPSAGHIKKTDLIIISDNAVTLDYVASQIIGFNPMNLETINQAINRGLLSKDNIKIIGKTKQIEYKKPMAAARKIPKWLNRAIYKIMREKPVHNKNCIKCGICLENCPVKAISEVHKKDKKTYTINRKKCIYCYCCHELCPHKGIDLKKSKLATQLMKIRNIIKV